MRKGQKHCILRCFYFPGAAKNRQNMAQKRPKIDFQKHLKKLTSFFQPRTPKNVKTPAGRKDLGVGVGGWGATPVETPRNGKTAKRAFSNPTQTSIFPVFSTFVRCSDLQEFLLFFPGALPLHQPGSADIAWPTQYLQMKKSNPKPGFLGGYHYV